MQRYLELNPKPFIKRLGNPLSESFLKHFGTTPVMSITQNDLFAWATDFQRTRGLSVKTMPNIKSAVNQFFQFIVDSKALAINPMAKVKVEIGKPPKERIILSESEIELMLFQLKLASPKLIYPVVFLLAHTGARIGEIFKLKWNDVHFDLSAIQLLGTKNGDDRMVQVSPKVLGFLKAQPQINEYVVLSQYKRSWILDL
jgi:integrase